MKGRYLRVATQILTGHAALNNSLSEVNRIIEPICPLCEAEEEAVSHLLGQCLMFGKLKAEFLLHYYATATDILYRYYLRQIINFVFKTKQLELSYMIIMTCLYHLLGLRIYFWIVSLPVHILRNHLKKGEDL